MPEKSGDEPGEGSAQRSAKGAPLLAEHSRRRQTIALFVAPVVFGVLAGPTLKWSLVAWWTLQIIGIFGAILAGREHKHGWSAALRGAFAGLLAGAVVVVFHLVLPCADVKSFEIPAYLAETCAGSAVLHLIGAAPRRIHRRTDQVAALLKR